jgi:hypothetical protein
LLTNLAAPAIVVLGLVPSMTEERFLDFVSG